MNAAVSVPLLTALALAMLGRRVGAVLPPPTAVRLLTLSAVTTSLACGFVLAVLGFSVAAQNSEVAEAGHWSVGTLKQLNPVSPVIGITAGLLVTGLAVSALFRAVQAGWDLTLAGTACRRLGHAAGGLVVIDDANPDAYALPGITGRVVVSTAMLRALQVGERRVLLAHESSHLRHRHHVYVLLSDVAAAANPLLRPVAAAVRLAVERWADEDAALLVGDRRLTASALARAGLAQTAATRRRAALPAAAAAVLQRTEALLGPPPAPRRLLASAMLTLVSATVTAGVVTGQITEQRFERAQGAYAASRPAWSISLTGGWPEVSRQLLGRQPCGCWEAVRADRAWLRCCSPLRATAITSRRNSTLGKVDGTHTLRGESVAKSRRRSFFAWRPPDGKSTY